jgi:hypothetical protein
METKNLVQLIREIKPRTALFTTYTLSLSFFESVLLPVLRQVGCHDIAILVDANEAVLSLAEAHVHYAGRRYWLAPVVAPGGGVFHPKLTYLAGAETDVLAVGSGNLTLPGQSTQLETLDAVSSVSAPSVFKQFEMMANGLADRIERTSKQAADLLREYGVRASFVAAKNSEDSLVFPEAPILVTSIERRADEQILELWQRTNAVPEAITTLSPFHAPDAGPIIRLAESLGIKRVSIGLDPKTLVAPFDQKRFKGEQKVRYVVPAIEGGSRRLHGKIFEIVGSTGVLVVTGSINATHQSFESTKNVEISLARWLPSPCFEWNEADPKRFESNAYVFKKQEPDFAFLDASLDPSGIVHGRLLGTKTIPASATVSILRSEVPLDEQTRNTVIGENGEFSFGPIGELKSDGALQLELTAPNVRATCWLNVVEELTSSDEDRRTRQCVRHILRGDFKSEDVVTLLQILCRAASYRPATKISTKVSTEPEPSTEYDFGDRPFSYLQWQMSGRFNSRRGLLGIRYGETLKAFIRWLNVDVEKGQSRVDSKSQNRIQKNQSFSDLSENPEPREDVDVEGLLRQLVEAIPRLFGEYPDADNADILASVAGAYALKLMLISTWTDERRLAPTLAWLDSYSRYPYRDTVQRALQPIVLGLAMVTAACAKAWHLTIPASLLKESLLRFGLGLQGSESLQELVRQALENEIFSCVDEELRLLAVQQCDDVWQAESIDDRLMRLVLASRESESKADPNDEKLFPGVVASLRRFRPVAGKLFKGVLTKSTDLKEGRGCPHCYRPFNNTTRTILQAQHAIVCNQEFCRKVIFYLEDPAIAKRIREVLTHV